MSQAEVEERVVELHVENIGGIDETTVELAPGVTILTGRNATNRTSLLQALMAGLGSERVALKADAEKGRVDLTVDDTTYTRIIRRQNGTIVTEGDPYLEDATLADLFAFLLESNDARRAVARGDDLRDIIMGPIDTADIKSQISDLQNQRDHIDQEIDAINELQQQLPTLEDRKGSLSNDIEEKQQELSEIKADIDEKDAEIESQIEEKEELEDKLDELSAVQSELEDVRHQLDMTRDSRDAFEEERTEVEADLEDYTAVPEGKIEDLDTEISRLRSRRNHLDDTIDQLQTVIQFNQNLLDGDLNPFADLLEGSAGDEDSQAVTDQLIEDDEDLTCWTCGSDITASQIEQMLDRFRELRDQHLDERAAIDGEISELRADQSELEERQRQREQLRSRLEQIDDELTVRDERLDDLEDRREDLLEQTEQLETAVESLRSDGDRSDLIDLHKEANQLEVEISRLETDREDVVQEIDRIEERLTDRNQLETQRTNLQSEIDDLRTKIDRIEQSAIQEFNEHMDTILDVLEYENIERIWLERTERQEHQSRPSTSSAYFEMHVIRSTEDGTVYEDQIDHLSESEREVTGLIFGLAGYLAHNLHEELPFMLIDSVESIDPTRLADLITYFTAYPQYLVAALLEDDAETLDDQYQRVSNI